MNRTIVTADQYILLTYQLPAHELDGAIPVRWSAEGVFADQTEVVKWMMVTPTKFHDYKIVKVNLPLLLRPDHATVDISELTEDGQVVELEDEPDKSPTEHPPIPRTGPGTTGT